VEKRTEQTGQTRRCSRSTRKQYGRAGGQAANVRPEGNSRPGPWDTVKNHALRDDASIAVTSRTAGQRATTPSGRDDGLTTEGGGSGEAGGSVGTRTNGGNRAVPGPGGGLAYIYQGRDGHRQRDIVAEGRRRPQHRELRPADGHGRCRASATGWLLNR